MAMRAYFSRAAAPRGLRCAALALALHLAAPQVQADERGPDASAAQPISALLERFRTDFGDARILEIDLDSEQSGGRAVLVYEIKAFTPRGAVLKILYDARTLERLSVTGRRERKGREQDD